MLRRVAEVDPLDKGPRLLRRECCHRALQNQPLTRIIHSLK
jgi:hypothetical protein